MCEAYMMIIKSLKTIIIDNTTNKVWLLNGDFLTYIKSKDMLVKATIDPI